MDINLFLGLFVPKKDRKRLYFYTSLLSGTLGLTSKMKTVVELTL